MLCQDSKPGLSKIISYIIIQAAVRYTHYAKESEAKTRRRPTADFNRLGRQDKQYERGCDVEETTDLQQHNSKCDTSGRTVAATAMIHGDGSGRTFEFL